MKVKDERAYYVFVTQPGEYVAKFDMVTRKESESMYNTGPGDELKTLKIAVGTPFACSVGANVSKNGVAIAPLSVATNAEGSSVYVYSGFQPGDVVKVGV